MNLRQATLCAFLALNAPAPWAQTQILPEPAVPSFKFNEASQAPPIQQMNDAELIKQPELLLRFLNQALDRHDWHGVGIFLPLYEQTAHPDQTQIEYAKAGLARAAGHYVQSILTYRNIVSRLPELTPVRLELATTLFDDRDNEAALFQFEKVRASKPPTEILSTVDRYVSAIRQRSAWHFNGGLNYISDSNINNASNDKYVKIGNFYFERTSDSLPQSGQGLSYFANMGRDLPVADQRSVTLGLSILGKNYWNNHPYDDLQARLSTGYKWQNARQLFSLTPFFQVRRFANSPYSKTIGLRSEWSYQLSNHWQVAFAAEYDRQRYTQREFLNGHSIFGSISANYVPSASLTFFGGVDAMKDNTNKAHESSVRQAFRAGVSYDLPWWNISIQAQANYAKRRFKDAPSIFGIRRLDTEREYSLSVWHRRLYFWGLTPKLNYVHNQTSSNVSLYNYRKNRIYLSLDSRF